jgi:hypothetical protein
MEIWPQMVCLVGADPDLDHIVANENAFLMALYNFQCQPRPATEQIAALCAPQRRPTALAHLRLPEALPGPEESRQRLRTMVATLIEELQDREAAFRMGKDRADLESVLKKTLVLQDGEYSRQFLRYHKEWSALFFRASGVLPLTLQRDASGFFDELAASYEDQPPPDGPGPGDPAPGSHADSDSKPTPADMGSAPAPEEGVMATPTAEAAGHPEVVAEQPRVDSSPSSALPASAGLAVAETAGATDRVGFPDPPSSALPASAGLAVAEAAGATDRVGFPDPPSSAPVETMQSINSSRVTLHDPAPMPRGHQAAVRSIRDGPQPTPVPPDPAPPAVRGSPQSRDGGPHGSMTPRGP